MSPVPGAPTMARPAQQSSGANQAASSAPAAPVIPFTRAARKKSRIIGTYGPFVLGAGSQQLAPIQVPANGYIRAIILDVTIASAGNTANVAFSNDGPFNVISPLTLAAANGDSLINPMDGFVMYVLNKYGCFANQGTDPTRDPTYTKVTGAVATGGSSHFQLEIPFEVDSRDGLGCLPNMAANQSFLLTLTLNALANLYTTAPTVAPSVTIVATVKYWAAPAASNANNQPQATAPLANGTVSLLQTQMPPITPSSDQTIQLTNVGNVIRQIIFILRTAAGVRTEADWPNVLQISVNNDVYEFKTKNNWRNDHGDNYGLYGGIAASPTPGALDNGVYIYTEFMNDGSMGCGETSGASNRDLMLVTGSATALNIEAQNWGAAAGQLLVVTNALKIADVAGFYAPKLI